MKVIDLTHRLTRNMPIYPGDDPFELTQSHTLERDGFNGMRLTSGMHVGTHIDMPKHLTTDERECADFPVESFILPGVVLDAEGEDVITMKPEYERLVKPGMAALIMTGFDREFSRPEVYYRKHPVMSVELGRFLAERGVSLVGLDITSPDKPPFVVHKLFLERGIFILENLTNLGALPERGFTLYAVPLKIEAEGSLVHAYTVV